MGYYIRYDRGSGKDFDFFGTLDDAENEAVKRKSDIPEGGFSIYRFPIKPNDNAVLYCAWEEFEPWE